MKVVFFLLLTASSGIICGPVPPLEAPYVQNSTKEITFLPIRHPDGRVTVEYLTLPLENEVRAKAQDLTFYLYTQSSVNVPEIFKLNQADSLQNSLYFDPSRDTIFITHGWNNDFSSPVNKLIKNAVLRSHNVNVFVVDWSPHTQGLYTAAFLNIASTGSFLGQFMQELASTHQYPVSRITAVGHSLGAHVTGVAGKRLDGKIGRIVGLDPAGPLFTLGQTNNRLAVDDAEYVEVIHTCRQLLGFSAPLGDVDYYPNDGSNQPGCSFLDDIAGTCSHGRAYQYFAESVGNNRFVATKCDSYGQFENGICDGNTKSLMGGFPIADKVTGTFYLKTAGKEPYGLGD